MKYYFSTILLLVFGVCFSQVKLQSLSIESKKEFSIHHSSELYRYEIFESDLRNGL